MKKLNLTSLFVIATLVLSSCSVEEDPVFLEEPNSKLFEKVKLQRDASGAYSLDMKVNNGVGTDILDNKKSNRKDIYLFSSENELNRTYNEDLSLNGQKSFTVGINNTITNKRSTITVFDDDIKFNRNSEDDHLASYNFTDNGDGTYDLDFVVDNGIKTDFVYNENTKTYEIHLEPGNSNESNFSRTFAKEEGEILKIDFINHTTSSATGRTDSSTKPKIVIGNGESSGS